MSGKTVSATRILTGFAAAAMAIGVILIVIKWVLAGVEFVGGPLLRVPDGLLQSGVPLTIVGWVMLMLLRARSEKEQG